MAGIRTCGKDNTINSMSQEDIQKWKHIIGELCVKATEEKIKSCLRQYDPEKPSKQT